MVPKKRSKPRFILSRRGVSTRHGTTIVETAIVLPVFLFFLLAIIEYGHSQMVNNVLRSACRSGARLGATEGRSTSDVITHVQDILGSAIPTNAAHVFVKDGSVYDTNESAPVTGNDIENLPNLELLNAEPRQMYLIRARIEYNEIALVPMPFMQGAVLQGQAYMRHE